MATIQGWSGSMVSHPEHVIKLRALESAQDLGEWVRPALDDFLLDLSRVAIEDVRDHRSVRDVLNEVNYWLCEAARVIYRTEADGDPRFWCAMQLDTIVYLLWARGLVARRYMERFANLIWALVGITPIYPLPASIAFLEWPA